jgi:hypothetical protein
MFIFFYHFYYLKTYDDIDWGMSRKGLMKIAPDEVRGELRRSVSIKSPNGTNEKIAACSDFHSSFQDFYFARLAFFPRISSRATFNYPFGIKMTVNCNGFLNRCSLHKISIYSFHFLNTPRHSHGSGNLSTCRAARFPAQWSNSPHS